jgi:hypothetical protein
LVRITQDHRGGGGPVLEVTLKKLTPSIEIKILEAKTLCDDDDDNDDDGNNILLNNSVIMRNTGL